MLRVKHSPATSHANSGFPVDRCPVLPGASQHTCSELCPGPIVSPLQATAGLCQAVHTCPWAVHVRASLGEAAVRASLRHAQAAERLMSLPAVESAARRRPPDDAATSVWTKVRGPCLEGSLGLWLGRYPLLWWHERASLGTVQVVGVGACELV